MPETGSPAQLERLPGPQADVVRAAFRELHGRRLHGFALLLTLGDRERAASLASDALAAGQLRVDELRHPERAAAWLRRHVVQRAASVQARRADTTGGPLMELGVDAAIVSALAALGRLERAALIAETIERLDRRDVGMVVGRRGAALDRLLHRARGSAIAAYGVTVDEGRPEGPIVARIRKVAGLALT